MKKIVIFSAHDLSNAYSSLFYFKNELEKKSNISVKIFGGTNIKTIPEKFRKNYYCLKPGRLGKIKIVGGIISRCIVFVNSIAADAIIINELEYFKTAFFIKKIFSKKIVVHYNTEMYGKDEGMPCSDRMMNFYIKYASFPDIIIECLDERAQYRKKKYNIDKEIFVINNSIPKLSNQKQSDYDVVKKYIDFKDNNPILIYAGGCNLSRGLSAIINNINRFNNKLNFLLFCYGSNGDIEYIKRLCKEKNNCRVYNAIDRELLFKIMRFCDIGIQYYNPKLSVNNCLAAPSKFFEYMAMGLNVISTNNKGINNIINKYNIGKCFGSDEQMYDVLKQMLDEGLKDKAEIVQIFEQNFCYEKDARTVVEYLYKLINSK